METQATIASTEKSVSLMISEGTDSGSVLYGIPRANRKRPGFAGTATASSFDASSAGDFLPRSHQRVGQGQMDLSLLDRATDILDQLDFNDEQAVILAISALRVCAYELWESATRSSDRHQSILAIVERALLEAESLTREQVSALREGFIDLSNHTLTESHVDVLRSRFIDQGFQPLAVLATFKDEDEQQRVGE